MIFDPHAVVDPWAVVVKSLNALVADCAMAASGGSDDFALRAEVCWVDISKKVKERLTFERLQDTWVPAARVKKSQQHADSRNAVSQLSIARVLGIKSWQDDHHIEQMDNCKERQEQQLCFVVLLERNQRNSKHQALPI